MKTIQCPFDDASLDCYPKADASEAVVVCPGGGYAALSKREDTSVARAFNDAGYHAFVLHYSVDHPPLGWRPLRQLGWAVSAVRRGIVPIPGIQQVAVCGFSTGGHLAASLGVGWHHPALFAPGADLALQRPDALILAYPVISGEEYVHRRAFIRLAGENPEAWKAFSVEKLVDEKSTPAFLWHTVSDASVSVQNSLLFFEALLHCGVPAELHLYPFGAHGMSLATPEVALLAGNRLADPHVATWMSLAQQWLTDIFSGRAQG